MKIRIAADSSCDLMALEDIDFVSAPLSIRTDEKEYIDSSELDVKQMVDELAAYHGRSYSACPNIADWERAFEGADCVAVFTITRNLSGSYAAANAARENVLERYPEKKIHIFDTLSAGPEITLAVWKMRELILAGTDFDTACAEVDGYIRRTGLLFVLKSLHNFAQNGRVSKIAAVAGGMLNIHVLGKASDEGTLEVLTKFRGAKKYVSEVMTHLKELGYAGGKALIGHVFNEETSREVRDAIKAEFSRAEVLIHPLRGLCSFYAENGGILIGFESQLA